MSDENGKPAADGEESEAAYLARKARANEAFIQRGLETVRQHTLDDKSIFAVARGIFHHLLHDQPRLVDGDLPAETQVQEQVDGEGNKVVPQAGGDGGN